MISFSESTLVDPSVSGSLGGLMLLEGVGTSFGLRASLGCFETPTLSDGNRWASPSRSTVFDGELVLPSVEEESTDRRSKVSTRDLSNSWLTAPVPMPPTAATAAEDAAVADDAAAAAPVRRTEATLSPSAAAVPTPRAEVVVDRASSICEVRVSC